MSTFHDSPTKTNVQSPPPAPAVDHQNPPGTGGGGGVTGILSRWKREDLLRKGSLWLRGIALLLSLIGFIVMATNKHGYGRNFDEYEEYRYVLAIAILSTLYTGGQVLRQARELSTGKRFLQPTTSLFISFFGDQIMAYLLISSASSAVPMTNRIREGADNIFTDSSAAAISSSFLAFFCLALSSLISGYELSTHSYI
ncbi:CASP-like protein 4B1 [Senna tora]|uniref:CASP-like protein n=1 Tax=Senna tora TaxID=362788 RepID=A0A834TPR3_9FABA|nr:CASP-like protein 4B1 [Senna tora]